MDQQTIRAVATSVDYVAEFVEWTYQVAMPQEHRRVLTSEVLSTWGNPDQSTRQLVIYLLDLRSKVAARPAAEHATYRGQAQRIFQQMLSHPEANDRGRVLGVLHHLLEQLRPGCTGVLPPLVPATAAPFGSPMPGSNASPLPAFPGAAAPPPAAAPAVDPVIDPAVVPQALQERMRQDMHDHEVAREKYQWDNIDRNIRRIWGS